MMLSNSANFTEKLKAQQKILHFNNSKMESNHREASLKRKISTNSSLPPGKSDPTMSGAKLQRKESSRRVVRTNFTALKRSGRSTTKSESTPDDKINSVVATNSNVKFDIETTHDSYTFASDDAEALNADNGETEDDPLQLDGEVSNLRKRLSCRQRFRAEWATQYPWLECKDEIGFCKLCLKNLANNITNIQRHAKSKSHTNVEMLLKCTTKSDDKTATPSTAKFGTPKFREQWKSQFPWLVCKEGQSFCTLCCKFLINNLTKIEIHQQRKFHQALEENKLKEAQDELAELKTEEIPQINDANDDTQDTFKFSNTDDSDSEYDDFLDGLPAEKSSGTRKRAGQRFRLEWKKMFPWLDCKDDKSYCTLCQKILANNITNISRHSRRKIHKILEIEMVATIPNYGFLTNLKDYDVDKTAQYPANSSMSSSDEVKKLDSLFQPKWKKQFKWLDCKDGKSYCTLCFTYIPNEISNIETHSKRKIHKNLEANLSAVDNIEDELKNLETELSKLDKYELKTTITETSNDNVEEIIEKENEQIDYTLNAIVGETLNDSIDDDCNDANEHFDDEHFNKSNDVNDALNDDESFSSDNCPKMRQRFRLIWQEQFPWVECKNGRSFCSLCFQFLANNITNIQRHSKRKCHRSLESAFKKQQKNNGEEIKSKLDLVKTAELKIMLFLCLFNLPFSMMPAIIELIKSIAGDNFDFFNDLKCSQAKATQTIYHLLTETYIDLQAETLRNKKVALIIDEAPPICSSKFQNVIIIVRYFDLEIGKLCERFLSIVEILENDTQSMFCAIIKVIKKFKIPFEHIMGVSANSASIKMECLNEIYTLLKNINPKICAFTCELFHVLALLNPASLGDSLLPLIHCVPDLVKTEEISELESEWKHLILTPRKEKSLEEFWHMVLNIKNSKGDIQYPHLKNFIPDVLCLTKGNAMHENKLKQINYIIDTARDGLNVNTVNSYMLARESIPWELFKNWTPNKTILLKYDI